MPPGSIMRAARQRSGLTLSQIAKMLGVSHPTVSRWERGQPASVEQVRAFLDACGASDAERLSILQSSTPAAPTPQPAPVVPSTRRGLSRRLRGAA
jgi:transcriptional regulator with XRE-family HTH domain